MGNGWVGPYNPVCVQLSWCVCVLESIAVGGLDADDADDDGGDDEEGEEEEEEDDDDDDDDDIFGRSGHEPLLCMAVTFNFPFVNIVLVHLHLFSSTCVIPP